MVGVFRKNGGRNGGERKRKAKKKRRAGDLEGAAFIEDAIDLPVLHTYQSRNEPNHLVLPSWGAGLHLRKSLDGGERIYDRSAHRGYLNLPQLRFLEAAICSVRFQLGSKKVDNRGKDVQRLPQHGWNAADKAPLSVTFTGRLDGMYDSKCG